MKARNFFAEISEGFEALKQEREGKITLRRHHIDIKPAPQVTSSEDCVKRKNESFMCPGCAPSARR